MEGKKVAESLTTMTELVFPNDTNQLNNLMGGNLMRWMDIVAAICAGRHCESSVVTASVDHVSFTAPIAMGDVVTLKAQVTRAFNTSVEIYVEVFAENIQGKNPFQSNHAYFTFVALDEDTKKPRKVPPVIALSSEEKSLYDSASRRREVRMILSGRIKPEDATDLRALFQSMG